MLRITDNALNDRYANTFSENHTKNQKISDQNLPIRQYHQNFPTVNFIFTHQFGYVKLEKERKLTL
jgi:hypothetical protein